MTKEEVIERIEGLYDIAKHESLDDEEDKEALDMAIKALEQESIDKSAMMYEIYMEGVNMAGEYQGCWVRFRDIEKIVNKYMTESEEKQTDDEFRVGDEVECPQIDGKGIVINKANKDTLLILSANMDGLLRIEENKVHKTGKHIDAIEEVLKQMREDNE